MSGKIFLTKNHDAKVRRKMSGGQILLVSGILNVKPSARFEIVRVEVYAVQGFAIFVIIHDFAPIVECDSPL